MITAFPGKEILVDRLRWAVRGECPHGITQCLREALCDLIEQRDMQLPDEIFQVKSNGYARRMLHHDDVTGCSVMAMTWGAGQGTQIHDHSGMWCVEGVWQGNIEVVQYELMAQEAGRYKFEPRTTMRAGRGSAGSLIPPHEYHTIRNPDNDQAAISIHIYSGEMTSCNIFHQQSDGWYNREARQLGND